MGAATIHDVIERWHAYLRGEDPDGLDALLDDDVVFYSPIVYTPQVGKAVTMLYLAAAKQTLPGSKPSEDGSGGGGSAFTYVKQVLADDTAVLEFETSIDGTYVNGVDIIRINDEGRIVEFRVMIRPLKAINLVHRQMGEALEAIAPEA
ncbi:MAG: nuclear transport factor 2 family protein [Microthrixaceae bacterium]